MEVCDLFGHTEMHIEMVEKHCFFKANQLWAQLWAQLRAQLRAQQTSGTTSGTTAGTTLGTTSGTRTGTSYHFDNRKRKQLWARHLFGIQGEALMI